MPFELEGRPVVALYARVSLDESSKDDRRYQEPENQLSPLRDYCKAKGWVVGREYVDRFSGANPARPAFRELIGDGLQRKFKGVVVWKLDRFSREGITNTLAYIRQLKERGVWVRSLTEEWLNTEDETVSPLLISIFSWAAAEERRKISERTKAGIRQLRAIGQWKGGRPKKKIV